MSCKWGFGGWLGVILTRKGRGEENEAEKAQPEKQDYQESG